MLIEARLANPPDDLVDKYSRREREFFFDYAEYILDLIRKPIVSDFLESLILAERIPLRGIDLRVMVFPAKPRRGRPRNILHGSYSHDAAQISLYPLKLPREWVRGEGLGLFRLRWAEMSLTQQKVLREAQLSAVSTLIHELLHVKLEARKLSRFAEEAIVRKLEKQYMTDWMENVRQSDGPEPIFPSISSSSC